MKIFELVAPCHMGLEAVLKREIVSLGYDIIRVEDGRATFAGDAEAICRGNIFLRTAQRILLQVGRFKAETFTELFDRTKALPWEAFIPADGKFWVKKANSVNSKLFSSSDIQSIVKKAIVERLKEKYKTEWFAEDGAAYPIRINILKDEVLIGLDTTGVSLHKRGYRPVGGKAPISECLAAAMIMLTPWKKDRILLDPFCGSGTIPIEAAMLGANMAPGMRRTFEAEKWTNFIPRREWKEVREEAEDLVDREALRGEARQIFASDADPAMVQIAKDNAKLAGVGKMIHMEQRDVREMAMEQPYGFVITNPPYGERMEEREALPEIYRALGEQFQKMKDWSAYVITAYEEAEQYFGRKADKNRKIYNGMIKTYFYQYIGPKPPRKKEE